MFTMDFFLILIQSYALSKDFNGQELGFISLCLGFDKFTTTKGDLN